MVKLLDYKARMYDAFSGRFIQPDTLVPEPGSSQGYNRYTYAKDNPILYSDPSGHCSWLALPIIIISAYEIAIYTHLIHKPSVPEDAFASTISDLVSLGYEHAKHANIIGEGLNDLQNDPSVQYAQDRVIEKIKSDSRYGHEAYTLPDSKDLSSSFNAVGSSGNWKQAALENNQAFWMVHNGALSATNTSVADDGTISTTWEINDSFDFIPNFQKRDLEYNLFAVPTYFIYNVIFGAKEKFPITAQWKEVISPN